MSTQPVEIDILLHDQASAPLASLASQVDASDEDVMSLISRLASLQEELDRLRSMPNLQLDQSQNVAQITRLNEEIERLRQSMSQQPPQAPPTPPVDTKPLEQAKRSVSGLHMSIQQLAREMPALSVGPQMFFMAISNNLPIFADELKRARQEYQALRDAGQQAQPVWKQVLSSMFSWQIALTVGVTLLVMYGKEIANWVGSLFGTDDALRKLEESKKRNLEIDRKAIEHSAAYRAEITQSINEINRFNGTKEEEGQLIDKLNGKYGETYGYMSTLAGWYTTLTERAEQYTRVLFLQHKQQQLIQESIKLQGEQEDVQRTDADKLDGAMGFFGKLSLRMAASYGAQDYTQFDPEKAINSYNIDNKQKKLIEITNRQKEINEELAKLGQEESDQQKKLGTNEVPPGSLRDLDNKIALKRKEYELAKTDKERAEIQTSINKLNADRNAIAIKEPKAPKAYTTDQKDHDIKALKEARLKALTEGEELLINATKEGFDRERALAELEHKRKVEDIEKREQTIIAMHAKLRKKGVNIPLSEDQQVKISSAKDKLNAELLYRRKIDEINQKEVKDTKDKANRLLAPYRTYAQERIKIEEDYQQAIAKLQESGIADKGNEEEARRVRDEAMHALDRKIAEREVGFKAMVSRISKLGVSELSNLLDQAQVALQTKILSGDASDTELATLRAKIQILEEQLVAAKAEHDLDAKDEGKRWERTHKALGKVRKEVGSLVDDMSMLDETTQSALKAALNIADGTIAMIDGIKTLSTTASAEMTALEKASVVLSVISAAFSLISSISSASNQAEEQYRRTIESVQIARIKYQQEYNRLLAEQNLLYREGETIFGKREMASAVNAMEQYNKAMQEYQALLKGQEHITLGGDDDFHKYGMDRLADNARIIKKHREAYEKGVGGLGDIRVITGSHTEGMLWWKSTYDEYKSLLEVYPQLVDAQGKLNKVQLEAIINNEKLAEGDKERLQTLLSSLETADKAKAKFSDYLRHTFGDLGNNMVSAVTTAIREGRDALEVFSNDVAKVFERLGEQLLYSLFFADAFKQLEQELTKIYDSKGQLTEEELNNRVSRLLDSFFRGREGDIRRGEHFAKAYKEKAKEKGYNIWSSDQGKGQQQAQRGAFTTMTQDQASKLEGMFTSGQVHWSNIDATLTELLKQSSDWTDIFSRIAHNTSYIEPIYNVLLRLRDEGIKVK